MVLWLKRVAALVGALGFAALLLSPVMLLFAVPRWAAETFFLVAVLAAIYGTAWFGGREWVLLWAVFWTVSMYLLVGGATYLRGQ